ncbi:MAG: hypothetical protein Tsb005_21640 [Gammaproteobacteria bacterium]
MPDHLESKPKKSFNEIKQSYEKIQSLDTRAMRKAIKSIAFDISNSYDFTRHDLSQLDFYIMVLKQTIRLHKSPLFTCTLANLNLDRLNLIGETEFTILGEFPDETSTESGMLALADLNNLQPEYLVQQYATLNYVDLINQGKLFAFSTSADGVFNTELRIVDSSEPVIFRNELQFLVDASETAIINTSTGELSFGDPYALIHNNRVAKLSLTPYNFKVCCYLLAKHERIQEFVIVLSPTEEAAQNDLLEVYSFGFVV